MNVPRSGARALLAASLLIGALAAAGLTAPAGAAPAAISVPPQATAALGWLAHEVAVGDGAANTDVLGQTLDFGAGPTFFPDYGLTADAVMAFTLAGQQPTEAAKALAKIEANLPDYVTGGAFGPDDRYAGALAKSLLLAEITGRDTHSFGAAHMDVEAELRARMQTTGVQTGRFSDLTGFGDFSNGFGQALAVIALSRTPGGVPVPALDFLAAQQCPAGGFRGAYNTAAGCTSNADADVDYTVIALDALLTRPTAAGVPAAITAAAGWLEAQQTASGGFTGSGGVVNANTAGLAAQALRQVEHFDTADRATAFVASMQLTGAQVRGDGGAIAFDVPGHDAAVTAGAIDATARDQFHRATAQGVLGFGLPNYSGLAVPVQTFPQIPTTTTVPVATTTVASGGRTTSTTAAGAGAGSGTTATSATSPASVPDPASVSALAAASGAAPSHGSLPLTGGNVLRLLILALALLGGGLVTKGEVMRRTADARAGRARS